MTTTAALNVLAQNNDGFAVMIEGGAVDWAGHGNDMDYQIEEHMDFDNAAQAVVDWVNANDPTWSQTLVIVSGDHETGDLWGPGGDFDPIADHGVGVVPGHSWQSGSHTNSLIPLYAQGAGAEAFNDMVIGQDGNLVAGYGLGGTGFDGSYIDNTSIYHTMMNAITVPSLPGDFNRNGQVEQGDLDSVLLNWGNPSDPAPPLWTNPDFPPTPLAIDQDDLDGVLLNWGNAAAVAALGVVPEPASASLLLIGGLLLGRSRRHG